MSLKSCFDALVLELEQRLEKKALMLEKKACDALMMRKKGRENGREDRPFIDIATYQAAYSSCSYSLF